MLSFPRSLSKWHIFRLPKPTPQGEWKAEFGMISAIVPTEQDAITFIRLCLREEQERESK